MSTFINSRKIPRLILPSFSRRNISTVLGNPHVYSIRDPDNAARHLLSLLPSTPPNPSLALGFTTRLPPTVDSFSSNSSFNSILNSVIATHASQDPEIKSQAQAMASSGGSNLGSGGVFFPNQRHQRGARTGTGYGGGGGVGGGGAGGASAQGGMGGAGRGGYIHVFDWRHPPDFGRIPDPEDIFGSLEVDGQGRFVDGHGRFQASGTYRIFTPDGILGLSPFLRERLVERLKDESHVK